MTIGLVQVEFDAALARFSVATKIKGPLTKIMRRDPETGTVVKDGSECRMAEGTLKTTSITSFEQLPDVLRRLDSNQALVHGISAYDLAEVTTKGKLPQARTGRPEDALPIIARSLDDLQYPEGPGLLMCDHDKARDNSVAENETALRSYRPAALVALIAGIMPEITDAGYVSTPSTSSCIYDKDDIELRGEGSGSHIYYAVKNGRDIPRFLEVLGKRLFLAGYGRVEISRSGSLLLRTLIDLLVGSPERLDFAAGAVCEDGLVQKLPVPTVQDGTRLNTALLPDLTPDEELAYKDTIDRLTELARPSQEIVKEQYVVQEASKLSTDRKISIDDARRVVLSRQNHVLTDDDLLYFAHIKGDAVSVADVLNDPSIYDNKPLADPLEPEYDGGSLTKARFFWNDGNPIINSFAHGQIKYTFKRYAADSTTACPEEDISGLLERIKTDCGAPHEVESIKMLSCLKSNAKSRFMQVRTQIKKINPDVVLSELDRDIHLFSLKKVSFKCSQYSSSSLSGAYPSSEYSQNEKVLHFRDVLIKTNGGGQGKERRSLVVESVAANLISEELRGHFAFDVTGGRWSWFTGSQWKLCSQTYFDTAVTDLLYEGAGDLGFRNVYQVGVAALLQKGGQNRLGEAISGTLPFLNGLLNISDKTLQPITPDNAFTWVLPFDYTESAKCPNFLKWLSAAVDGDQETVRLLQAWLNALLTGRPDLQVFLHLIGPGGTGKSTFGRIVFILVGNDNATTTSLKQLETNRFEAANIYGKRLVAIEEADKYGGSVSVLKSMTGQDPLRLERKNQQQSGSFIYGGQTIMMSNERLSTTDYTSGIERRRITVEFKHRITDEEKAAWRDRGGEEGIIHSEAPGIINWALTLTRDEVTEIFKKLPERIKTMNMDAARFNNPILDWLFDNLIHDPDAQTNVGIKAVVRTPTGETIFNKADVHLYPNYLTWCVESSREAVSSQRFSANLVETANANGIAVKKLPRASNGIKIQGIRIRQEHEPLFRCEDLQQSVNTSVKDNYLIMKEMNTVNTPTQLPIWEQVYAPLEDGSDFVEVEI